MRLHLLTMLSKFRNVILNRKIIFLVIFFDYIYNVLLQPSCLLLNNRPSFFFFSLYETVPIHIITAFMFMGVIWYGPILCACYIVALIYEKQCETQKISPFLCLSPILRFYVQMSTHLWSVVWFITPLDFLFFNDQNNICIGPDLVFYSGNVYQVIDIFLLFYSIFAGNAGTYILLSRKPLSGRAVFYCVILLLLPPLIFSVPGLTDVGFDALYSEINPLLKFVKRVGLREEWLYSIFKTIL